MTDLQAKHKTAALLVRYYAQVSILNGGVIAVYRMVDGKCSRWNTNGMRWVDGKCACLTLRSSWFTVQSTTPEAVLAFQRQKVLGLKAKAVAWLVVNHL